MTEHYSHPGHKPKQEPFVAGSSPHKHPGKPMPCDDLQCVRNNGKGSCGDCLVWMSSGLRVCNGGHRRDLLEM